MPNTTNEDEKINSDYYNPFVEPSASEKEPVIVLPTHFTSADWTKLLKKFQSEVKFNKLSMFEKARV